MRARCAFEPKPVHHLSSAPSRLSPFLDWPFLLGAPGSVWPVHPRPLHLSDNGMDPPGPSHLQLQVTTRLDAATEATFLEHLTGSKILLVHIKEWEEFGLEGAEDLTWYCHYHLFS